MDRFDLHILGCGSATPSAHHLPSCQVVNFREKLFMIDCGEGAQLSLRRHSLKFNRLSHIFISHLHGDHVLGLPGMLSTFALHGKGGELTIHTFAEGEKVLRPVIDFFCRERPFDIRFNVITPHAGIIYEDSGLTVETFPLYHRVRCTGFIFREKPRERHFIASEGKRLGIPVSAIAAIKEGADFVMPDGRVIPNHRITSPPSPVISYAYCSDTMADERVAESISGVDVVYHEATYASDLAVQARQRGHSTAAEAARIARRAGAKALIIGHYSKRYPDPAPLLQEARSEFGPAVTAANEGLVIDLHATASLSI